MTGRTGGTGGQGVPGGLGDRGEWGTVPGGWDRGVGSGGTGMPIFCKESGGQR